MSDTLNQIVIDAEHPWPGLMPFTEAARNYFHGRDVEAAELQRLIRREKLTVLFGQSGLGKSSLLNAGLFPRLRAEDFLPIYIRLDVSESAPEFRLQVQRAIAENCEVHGVDAPLPKPDESLWGYFHQRDTDFWSLKIRLLVPVLVFDQFEEIFTLGRHVESLEQRCREFIGELADLIEDRMPASLAVRIEADPTLGERLDYAKEGCKVVFSFREDYLPEFESLRKLIRPIMQNRMRLTRLSGEQAVSAVLKSGADLVREAVAEQIVRFVAAQRAGRNSDELERLEVEPALLSVVCRELNNQRLRGQRREITAELLQGGAQQQIIHDFYEDSLNDLDERVRFFVEDQLLTDAGYRDSAALDDALAFPGVTREAVDVLIGRRLLRLEERSGVLRVELTHDVLTRVACESRDLRRQEEADRRHREEELSRRNRNRRLAFIGGGVLSIAIGIAVVFGVLLQRASVQREQLETTQSYASLSRANAALDQGVPGEPYALLADAVRVNPANGAALRRAVSLMGQRRHAQLLERTALATPADAAWFAPDHYLLFGNLARAIVGTSAMEILAVRAANDEHADFGQIQLFTEKQGKPGEVKFSEAARQPGPDEGWVLAYQAEAAVLPYVSRNRMLHLFDPASRKLHGHPLQLPGMPQALVVSPSRSWIAALMPAGQVLLLSADGRFRASVPIAGLGGAHESPLAFVTDAGGLLLRGSEAAEFRRPVADGEFALSQRIEGSVEVARLDPQQQVFALAMQKEVRFFDARTAAPIGDAIVHPSTVRDLAFSSDGQHLATACLDKLARVWNVGLRNLAGPPLKHHGAVLSVRFANESGSLLSGSADGAARLWSIARGELLLEPMVHPDPVAEVLPEPGGDHLLVLTNGQELYRWNLRHVAQQKALAPSLPEASVLAVSADGRAIAWGNASGGVSLQRPGQAEAGWALPGDAAAVLAVQFSTDGSRLAVARANGDVSVHDASGGQLVGAVMKHSNGVHLLRFSHNGRWLATGSQDRSVRVHEVERGEPLGLRVVHRRRLQRIAFSPDDRLLMTADRERIELWDFAAASPRGEWLAGSQRGESARLITADFVEAGDALLVLTADRLLRLELAAKGAGRLELDKTPALKALLLRDFKPWSATLSPNRRRLAIGSLDGRVRYVDIASLAYIGEVMRHDDAVVGLAYAADGKTLLSWSRDRVVRLWDALSGYAVADSLAVDGEVIAAVPARGSLVLATAGRGGLLQTLGAVPEGAPPLWLAELLELLGGMRMDKTRTTFPIADRRAELEGFVGRNLTDAADPWQQWARQAVFQMSGIAASAAKESTK